MNIDECLLTTFCFCFQPKSWEQQYHETLAHAIMNIRRLAEVLEAGVFLVPRPVRVPRERMRRSGKPVRGKEAKIQWLNWTLRLEKSPWTRLSPIRQPISKSKILRKGWLESRKRWMEPRMKCLPRRLPSAKTSERRRNRSRNLNL